MSTYTERARKLRPYIEQAAQGLDDKTASEAPNLLRKLTANGKLVKAGTESTGTG